MQSYALPLNLTVVDNVGYGKRLGHAAIRARALIVEHATLIPGELDTIENLRARGLRIGTTTGYTRSIMQRVLPLVAAQGFVPDNLVCADDMRSARPTPMNMYRCFIDLDVWPASCVRCIRRGTHRSTQVLNRPDF